MFTIDEEEGEESVTLRVAVLVSLDEALTAAVGVSGVSKSTIVSRALAAELTAMGFVDQGLVDEIKTTKHRGRSRATNGKDAR